MRDSYNLQNCASFLTNRMHGIEMVQGTCPTIVASYRSVSFLIIATAKLSYILFGSGLWSVSMVENSYLCTWLNVMSNYSLNHQRVLKSITHLVATCTCYLHAEKILLVVHNLETVSTKICYLK